MLMTDRKTNPQIFVIEREFAYPPERVFFALTNADAKSAAAVRWADPCTSTIAVSWKSFRTNA